MATGAVENLIRLNADILTGFTARQESKELSMRSQAMRILTSITSISLLKGFKPGSSLMLATAFFGFASSAAFAQPQLSGTPIELRGFLFPSSTTVNINGEGELTAYKDLAKVSLLVTTAERSLEQAMTVNQQLRLGLINAFLAAGIAEDDINNSKFSSSPQFGLFGRNPNSFEVTARLEVNVSSEEHLQLLAAAADENDEIEFESTEYEHSLEDDFEDRVRALAMEDVMAQKAYYEDSLGLELKAVNFFHGGIRQMSRAQPIRMAAAEMAADRSAVATLAAPVAVIAPTFDEIDYQTNLTVVFEIVDAE